ncbi:MAG: ribonuclease HII [Anaerolineaceae bacterium]|nr:ribonuclease HII [Anaerolineaceae bacterium]
MTQKISDHLSVVPHSSLITPHSFLPAPNSECHKPSPTLDYESALWHQGFLLIAGIDEAGRGSWAGPVTAGAVILPADPDILNRLEGVRDSKLMTPVEREAMFDVVKAEAQTWAVGEADAEEIDRIGILNATKNAMKRAIEALKPQPVHLLIDYVRLHDVTIPQTGIKHGDMLSLSIACASVLAKVTRDRFMRITAAELYPQYRFDLHKGYGTKLHQEMLAQYGPCPIHRRSFRPLADKLTLF